MRRLCRHFEWHHSKWRHSKWIVICALMFGFIHSNRLLADPVPAQDQATIQLLVKAITHQDSVGVAKLIRFPLPRTEPLSPIKNVPQFMEHYSEFFDEKTVSAVLGAMSAPVKQGGFTTLRSGMIWIQDGKITAINLRTDRGEKVLKDAQEYKKKASETH